MHDLAAAPLILTLRLDAVHQRLFDRLRDAHFPPARNYLSAHVTLFHALPGAEAPAISKRLRSAVAEASPPPVRVEPPFSLGRGVAFRLSSPEALELRASLATDRAGCLTPQDRAKLRLHVTVQNKVTPAEAKTLLGDLLSGFAPSGFESPGLDLWRYLGGPWAHVAGYDFAG